jgi:hypothetical protein
MGPSPQLTRVINAMEVDVGHAIRLNSHASWYAHPPSPGWWIANPPPVNNHTLVIHETLFSPNWPLSHGSYFVNTNPAIKYRHYIKYDFRDLVKFKALEKLVVMISRMEILPADEKEHIVWKALNVVKTQYPSFKIPELKFRGTY